MKRYGSARYAIPATNAPTGMALEREVGVVVSPARQAWLDCYAASEPTNPNWEAVCGPEPRMYVTPEEKQEIEAQMSAQTKPKSKLPWLLGGAAAVAYFILG